MNTKPIYRNGELANITPAGVLVICAEALYRPDREESTQDPQFCIDVIAGVLSAARNSGYAQGDILETLLAKGPLTPRIGDMAREACAAAGDAALRQLFDRIGLVAGVEGSSQ
jgi:hypothetical protein